VGLAEQVLNLSDEVMRINYFFKLSLLLFLAIQIPVSAQTEQENIFLKMNRDLEEWNLEQLAHVQDDSKSKLASFETDGCSGGLSDAWKGFARISLNFKKLLSDRPPWELCCVTHDRAYWKGDTENGFDKRLQADKALGQCVFDYGIANSKGLAAKFNVTEEKVLGQFKITSKLMYRAVRLGGKPCSYLPWRWGYGWPHCKLFDDQDQLN